ncbi:hypothetical protein [Nocardia stercoris]|uniref:Uncharacterized protein n=1 Tax=Nocardia stercoris TaxID=2483361 RepID=A0A3M2LCA3_9NOCA|nr:hypothetical protein [Nocardia stercoris]RMI34340.1 hypothetical protein EBN03_08115 [Nocardia stercoris]
MPNDFDTANSVLRQAFSVHGVRMTQRGDAGATLFTADGSYRFDLRPWLGETLSLTGVELAAAARRRVAATLAQLAAGTLPMDFDSHILRVRMYAEESLADRADSIVTRRLAPGLSEAVVIDLPEGPQLLAHGELDGSTDEIFAAAVAQSLSGEIHTVSTQELGYGTVTVVTGPHRYVGATIHDLAAHVDPEILAHGAVVSFPLPEYLLVYPLGQNDVHEMLFDMRTATTELFDAGAGVSPHCYWWRPGSGLLPDLQPVGVGIV